ncbi:Quinolinate synthase A [Streptomyces glaucescens]
MTTAQTQELDVQPTPLALLLLGREADPRSERGVECPGDLPSPSDPDLVERARAAKEKLGDKVFVLGHHYQRDEVIQFADVTGDSFKLARDAAARPEAEYIVFCGVHFMAESADILTSDDQKVVLPDLAAGCSMADMATAEQVAECWDVLTDAGIAEQVVPVSYMNSSADIKAFTGKHGGTICTSSNAKRALDWAFEQGEKVLFLPDQHLGRNTAVRDMGMSLDDCVVYNPHKPNGGLTAEELRGAKMILWRGHCSVHGRFSLDSVNDVRERIPGVNVLVHPECRHEVVAAADYVGSTEYIIKTLEAAPAGCQVGHRHRAEPGPPPGEPFRPRGQGDRLPRQDGLLLLHHEPHRPPPPGLGPRIPGRGKPRQPHRGRQGDRGVRQAGAGADAGAAVVTVAVRA